MRFEKVYVPYGGYWSTPFAKWQGSLAHLHAVKFAAEVVKAALEQRKLPAAEIDTVMLGSTVPQKHVLYGGPWLAAMLGAESATGPMVAQACATGARVLVTAAQEIELGGERTVLTVTADRCSNGPHVYYPNPSGPGGTGDKEDWVLDNFAFDPWARNSMLQTAENVAAEAKISRQEQDAVALLRFRQYQDALADDRAFQKRYMVLPLPVPDTSGRKVVATMESDEGVFPTTEDGLAKLKPVVPEGSVTFGSQTHPADGNCGMLVTSQARAAALSRDPRVTVRVLAYGEARVKKGYMAMATVPAARAALQSAGIPVGKLAAIKTHNPFAVNDVYFAREMGVKVEDFNRFGSSLVFGHPQGPTGTRLVMELIEELALRGGGHGLFVGCAAGDSAAAVVVEVR
ncbi:MAG TPA: thiolase family protein, partial [Candidatus Polarisedimenticolaceae bacterium]|nr:thiolase family protein [Candidatus Polarisedimenticolaceae bacterium]